MKQQGSVVAVCAHVHLQCAVQYLFKRVRRCCAIICTCSLTDFEEALLSQSKRTRRVNSTVLQEAPAIHAAAANFNASISQTGGTMKRSGFFSGFNLGGNTKQREVSTHPLGADTRWELKLALPLKGCGVKVHGIDAKSRLFCMEVTTDHKTICFFDRDASDFDKWVVSMRECVAAATTNAVDMTAMQAGIRQSVGSRGSSRQSSGLSLTHL